MIEILLWILAILIIYLMIGALIDSWMMSGLEYTEEDIAYLKRLRFIDYLKRWAIAPFMLISFLGRDEGGEE